MTQWRVLLVDDEVSNAQVLGTILEEEGYHVTMAGDGRQALARLDEAQPDLLITDVMMPGMSGFELVAAIRQRTRYAALPVLVMSGAAAEALALHAAQCDVFLRKPFALDELLGAVERLLGPPQAERSA